MRLTDPVSPKREYPFFAWRPVETDDGSWVWWEWVSRYRITPTGPWLYRRFQNR